MKCMFDTNVFNDILDGKILLGDIRSDVICYVTHIQRDEINKTKDDSRRKLLINIFTDLVDEEVSTNTVVLGVSKLGMAKLSDGKLFHDIKERLDNVNRKKSKNNGMDALIGEVEQSTGSKARGQSTGSKARGQV